MRGGILVLLPAERADSRPPPRGAAFRLLKIAEGSARRDLAGLWEGAEVLQPKGCAPVAGWRWRDGVAGVLRLVFMSCQSGSFITLRWDEVEAHSGGGVIGGADLESNGVYYGNNSRRD